MYVEPASQRDRQPTTNIIKERLALPQARLLQLGDKLDARSQPTPPIYIEPICEKAGRQDCDDLVHTRSSGIVFVAAVLGPPSGHFF